MEDVFFQEARARRVGGDAERQLAEVAAAESVGDAVLDPIYQGLGGWTGGGEHLDGEACVERGSEGEVEKRRKGKERKKTEVEQRLSLASSLVGKRGKNLLLSLFLLLPSRLAIVTDLKAESGKRPRRCATWKTD